MLATAVCQLRVENQFPEFDSGCENILAESADVLFVTVHHLVDQANVFSIADADANRTVWLCCRTASVARKIGTSRS